MPKIELGTILKERYKITKLLGSGGMGEVLLADDQTLETQVAVKINHNLNETSSAQFIREARLLAALKHPNLPRVIDYFTDNDCQYLVMDFIPGDDLRTIVERHDKMDPNLIVHWGVELGNALTYLHTHKPPIYHRDIKPANIKLTPSGEVVLVDFGIAKSGEASQETQTGAWAFSPGFAPPEQVSGMRTGPYSDQYGLAATLYYLFVGKAPADSAQRMMGTADYVPLYQVNPVVSRFVSDAIGKALSIKPDDRFASVAEFLTALTNPDATVRGDAQKTVIASRGGVSGIPPVPPVTPTDTSPQRKSSTLWIGIGIAALLVIVVVGYFALKLLGVIGGGVKAEPTILAPTVAAVTVPPVTQENTATLEAQPTETSTVEPTQTTEPTAAAIAESVGHGGKVAFISNRQGDGFNQIWLMDVGKDANGNLMATNFKQVTTSPSDKSQPSWSPDGTKLLFSAPSTDFAQNGSPFAKDIWVIDITKEKALASDLTKRAGDDVEPAWSATGRKIAFTSYYREDKMPQIFIMNPDGSEQVRLSDRFAEHSPTWTPNDSYLMYVMDYADYFVLSMRDIWSVYVNTKKFDMSSDAGRLGLVSEPQISADGLMIIYTRTVGTKTNIYTAVYADRGRTTTQITDSGKDSLSCWAPDSKWILFTSTRDDNSEIYIIASDGSGLTNLTNFPSEDTDPAWQPPAK
ncbi:MAG: protein kinase [Anaerolineaceae bacterium]